MNWREIKIYEVEASIWEEGASFWIYRYFYFDDKEAAEAFCKLSTQGVHRHIKRSRQVLLYPETNKIYHIPEFYIGELQNADI